MEIMEISWRRKCQPTPVLLPGKFHGQRRLVGYSPWGCKELDTTERLHLIKYSVGNLGHDLSKLKSLRLNAGPKAPFRQKLIRKWADKVLELKDQSQNPQLPKKPDSLGKP